LDTVIKVLVENTTPRSPLLGEYGFSAQVLVDQHNILFDTGSQAALFSNSAALGVDLSQVQDIIISHGHYDHTGAIIAFISQDIHIPVYLISLCTVCALQNLQYFLNSSFSVCFFLSLVVI
jgi:7,8-dihydropterin-6-yl-methyl-4-(beta-D-ribofuranosyl)aminobenzene 5'-phosphate synthase